MAISHTGRKWILLVVGIIVLGAAGFTARIWYANHREWHNPKAVPLFGEIEPAERATVYGSDVWIRWSSPTAAKGRVLWRTAGSTRVQSSDAGTGQELLAHLASLSAGSKYEYIVEQTDGSQTLRSSVRTLNVKSGLSFDPVIDQTVEHDYDQSVKLTLRNHGSQSVTVGAKALKQFGDLPSEITGYGSVDVPGQISPNGTLDLRLAVTAADATQDTYEIPIVAAGAYAMARFHVRTPKLNIAFKVLSEDSKTLAKTVEIRNNGDVLTDLAVRAVPENQTDLQIQPGVKHARVISGGTINITVTPILYLEFQSLKAEIEAAAAGQSAKFPLEFQAPPGVRLIAFRSASGAESSCQGGYCTNNPNTCSECAGPPGSGAVAGSDPPQPKAGGCESCKPDKRQLCTALANADQVALGMISWAASFHWKSKGSAGNLHTPTGDEWNKTLLSQKPTLAALLQQALNQLCDNKAVQETLDHMIKTLDSLNPEQTKSGQQVLREAMAIAGISDDLENLMDSVGCTAPKPDSAPATGPCSEGTKEKDEQDNEALKQVWDGFKEAYEKAKEETDDLDKAKPEVGSKAWDDLQLAQEKLRELKKAKEYVEMIRAARCVPPDVLDWFKKVMDDQRNHSDPSADCNNLCSSTADWVKKMSGTSDYQKKVFIEACMNFCGGLPHVPNQ